MSRETKTVRVTTAGVALAVVAVDLICKEVAFTAAPGSRSGLIVPVLNDRFSTGLVGAPWPVMVTLAVLGIAAAGWWTMRLAGAGRLPIWVPGLVVGGALANLADRVATGAVHDFLATPILVVNIADLAVLVGLIACLFARPKPAPNQVVA